MRQKPITRPNRLARRNRFGAGSGHWFGVGHMSAVLLLLGALGFCGAAAHAASMDLGGGTRIETPLTSFKAMRDRGMIRQALDYSCGAAALATILTYGFDDPVGEREILHEVLTPMSGDQEAAVRKEGLSLLDLQRVAEARGYRTRGFRLGPDFLAKLDRPVIVFIRPRGYNHFAVLKGIRGGRVYLADPALGNVRMPAYRFLESWLDESGRGVVFVIETAGAAGPRLAFPTGGTGPAQPEVMTARQLLKVGDPYVRFPRLNQ